MPRHAKAPRLWLRKQTGRDATFFIVDRKRQISTGCGPESRSDAESQLAAYVAARHEPTRSTELNKILIADVITLYVREHAPTVVRPDFIAATAAPIVEWWGEKTLADVRGATCRDYIKWRTAQKVRQHHNSKLPSRTVSEATARHDLKTLRAAINYWHAERGPLLAVPVVTVPSDSEGATRWLTRSELARLLNAVRKMKRNKHLCRFIMIGYYTGTRSGAIMKMRWLPSITGGWVDVDGGVIYRRGDGQRKTKKLQTPVRIPEGLLPHLKRWKRIDEEQAVTNVVHILGRPIAKLRRSWATARDAAQLDGEVVPHTLRHTCATYLMQAGIDIFQAAGFLGMSVEMLTERYGHHHPDFQKQAAQRRVKK